MRTAREARLADALAQLFGVAVAEVAAKAQATLRSDVCMELRSLDAWEAADDSVRATLA